MRIWFKTCLVFLGVLVITEILNELIFTYNPFNLRLEFTYYKWVIPCFFTTFYLNGQMYSTINSFIASLLAITLLYGTELLYQYHFSGILIDYVYPVTLWELRKTKLMIFLQHELKPLPWFMAGLLGYLFRIGYKVFRKKKYQVRNIYG
jgi:hypothetical protein